MAIAADCFQIERATLGPASAAGRTPGWDSLGHLDLVLALEEEFGIRLKTREILRITTLADAVEIVASREQ
jgi:acyl carrier protein